MSKKGNRSSAKKQIDAELDFMNEINEVKNKQLHALQFKIANSFKTAKQKELFTTIAKNRITFVRGCPGTGKTYVALMAGLTALKNKTANIAQIVLTKPIIESSVRSMGFLPGDLHAKTGVYYSHFYDNIAKLVGKPVLKFLSESGYITEENLNFLRGKTLNRYTDNGEPLGYFCVADEFQNTNVSEMKTFISRMGEGSKLVIMGDPEQIDAKLSHNERCGLVDAWDRLAGVPEIGFVEFVEEDIVRDPMLKEIMKRYRA